MIFWLWACSGNNPELEQHRQAVEAWREGEAHAEAGEWEAAREDFARARQHRPDDVLLVAWEAQALAEQGELDEAIALLDGVLAARPTFPEARYNRAAYYARKGDAERAAEDLQKAIDLGAARSRDVLEDPDFAGILGHPALGFLPRETLSVAVEFPDGPVFWGSDATLRLRIAGAMDETVRIEADPIQGPVELVRVVEDRMSSSQGPFVDLSWTLRAVGAGKMDIGPMRVIAGSRVKELEAFTLETTAPPGKEGTDSTIALRTPRQLAGDEIPPAAWQDAESLYVLSGPVDRHTVVPEPAALPLVHLLREEGQTSALLFVYPRQTGEVIQHRGGLEIFRTSLEVAR